VNADASAQVVAEVGGEAPSAVPPPAVSSPAGSHAAPSRSTLGVWALVMALLGLTFLPIVGSAVGFVLGRVAVRKADSSQVIGGRGLAVSAVVISIVTLAVIALAVAGYALAVAYLGI
jgi:putative exporter of polyketide antibiotics